MPNFERNLRQTCTYWEQTGTDQFNKPVFATPTPLPCRWENIAELVIDKHGQTITSKSRIFLAIPIRVEGYLWLGTSTEASPLGLVDASEIRQVKGVPDLGNLKQMYTVWL